MKFQKIDSSHTIFLKNSQLNTQSFKKQPAPQKILKKNQLHTKNKKKTQLLITSQLHT